MSLVSGTRLGPYEIQSAIGAGGMGEVYKARDTRLDRTVAIKVLPPAVNTDPERRSRFEREAKTIAGLNHPHICTLHDVGDHDGVMFLVMELLEGEPLRARLSRSRTAVPVCLDVAIQLAEALEAAHAKGVIHRDIKPENIFITTRDAAKLLDFGIAKLATGRASGTAAVTARVVASGPVALGTVGYMSPEQVRGETLDERTDLFSLGVVLYEMTTGTAPFRGATSGAVAGEVLTRAPTPPVRLNPDVPADLERIVNKLLEKDRLLRYQSARDVRVDLERLRRRAPDAPALGRPEQASIVVLPFENLSPDPENAFFADGLTEELIADLSKVRAMRVISRTSAMLLRGAKKDLPTIGRDLNVRYVLEGSVRRAGQALRITAQLIEAGTDTHVWAEKYAGNLDNVFAMQEQVSRAIVEALQVNLTAEEHGQMGVRPLTNVAAYDCYLRARNEIWRFDEASLERAIALAQQGLDIVGENELLYAALGMAYCQFAGIGLRAEASLAKAEEYATRIAVLAPHSPRAHFLRGVISNRRGDMQEAVRHLKLSLAGDPNDAEALLSLVYAYLTAGKPAAARPFIRRLLAVDPLTFVNQCMPGWADAEELRFEEAIESYHACYRSAPENPLGRFLYAWALLNGGHGEEGLAILEDLWRDRPDQPIARVGRAVALALGHDTDEALRAAESPEVREAALSNDFFAVRLAECYALLGKAGDAAEWMEHARRRGVSYYHLMFPESWFFASNRGDARLVALMLRMQQQCNQFEV